LIQNGRSLFDRPGGAGIGFSFRSFECGLYQSFGVSWLTRHDFGAMLDGWFGHLWFLEHLLVYALLYVAWRLLTARRSAGAPLPVPGNAALLIYALLLGLLTYVIRIDFRSIAG
jgi:hypothetical protein